MSDTGPCNCDQSLALQDAVKKLENRMDVIEEILSSRFSAKTENMRRALEEIIEVQEFLAPRKDFYDSHSVRICECMRCVAKRGLQST